MYPLCSLFATLLSPQNTENVHEKRMCCNLKKKICVFLHKKKVVIRNEKNKKHKNKKNVFEWLAGAIKSSCTLPECVRVTIYYFWDLKVPSKDVFLTKSTIIFWQHFSKETDTKESTSFSHFPDLWLTKLLWQLSK